MHKSAEDLKPRDCFLMAGAAYEVRDVYEVDEEEKIKIAFTEINGSHERFQLTINRDVMMTTL